MIKGEIYTIQDIGMRILLIQKDGLDLYATLVASETSRIILRFYRPERVSCGVLITTASLGSALSLASELRWYIRRYMREVLFEIHPAVYCTHTLAEEVYQRDAHLEMPWPARCLYGFKEGRLAIRQPLDATEGKSIEDEALSGMDHVIEVWSHPSEPAEREEVDEETMEEPQPGDYQSE
ncbi:MAG TPA: DUF5804 family protein [Methanomicrobiales archaeon]|nr:DUF5804 family protein [Methanomicrobiales archaeon]